MLDPYHRWLAIPRDQRPPTFYQLLGIAPNETDAEVIKEAALRQASHIRTYQTGRYAKESQALLNEIGQAKVTLLNPDKRKEYDARLGLTGTDRITPGAAAPEASPFAFDFQAGDPLPGPESLSEDSRRPAEEPASGAASPPDTWERPPLLALAFAGLLMLGGVLAFWLSFTRPAGE